MRSKRATDRFEFDSHSVDALTNAIGLRPSRLGFELRAEIGQRRCTEIRGTAFETVRTAA